MSERESHKGVWEKFIRGEVNSLLELYNQHYIGLVNYGRTIINDRDFVTDCFMDMLLVFWNKRSALPPVENVRSYLMTSFRRELLHKIESGKRREQKHRDSERLYYDNQSSYEDHLVQLQSDSSLKAKISTALTKLTARQAELIRLKFFEDLDYDEIARICNISKRTAYNIIYDALKILKDELYGDQNSSFSTNLASIFVLLSVIRAFHE